jgi:hypothetical protein
MVGNHLDLYAKLVEKSQARGVPDASRLNQNRVGGAIIRTPESSQVSTRRP